MSTSAVFEMHFALSHEPMRTDVDLVFSQVKTHTHTYTSYSVRWLDNKNIRFTIIDYTQGFSEREVYFFIIKAIEMREG